MHGKIVYLTKIETAYCNRKRQFLSEKNTFVLNCTINFFCKSCTLLCSKKTQSHRNINKANLFRLKYTKCPFLYSSKLDHTICPDLFLVTEAQEVWKDQFHFAEKSLAACYRYCHCQRFLQSNSKNVRRTSGRDNFKLHGLKPAFCSLDILVQLFPIYIWTVYSS